MQDVWQSSASGHWSWHAEAQFAKLVQQVLKPLRPYTGRTRNTRAPKDPVQNSGQSSGDSRVVDRRNLSIPDGNIEWAGRISKGRFTYQGIQPSYASTLFQTTAPDHVHTHRSARSLVLQRTGKIKNHSRRHGTKRHRPHHYFEFIQWHEFEPGFIVDIPIRLKPRWNRRGAYSQFTTRKARTGGELTRPDFYRSHRTRCRYWSKIGVKYGEPFISPFSWESNLSIFDHIKDRTSRK